MAGASSSPRIDVAAVAGFCDRHGIGSGPTRVERFGGGHSNLTYAVERGGARVVLRRDPSSMTILVEDDGQRGGIWTPGVGLTSMAERAAELGGTLCAGPGTDQPGGRVEAHLPRTDTP